MEVALGYAGLVDIVCLVKGIGVESLVGNHVVLQQRLEIFLSVRTKQKGINPWSKFLEREVRGGEDCAANVVRGIIHGGKQAGLGEAELEGTEFTGEEADDVDDLWRWDEDAIYAVDDTIGSELRAISLHQLQSQGGEHTMSIAIILL